MIRVYRLECGFLQMRCDACPAAHLVAFSCKLGAFSAARRMAESAALVGFPAHPVLHCFPKIHCSSADPRPRSQPVPQVHPWHNGLGAGGQCAQNGGILRIEQGQLLVFALKL